jgi:hypothetical protein
MSGSPALMEMRSVLRICQITMMPANAAHGEKLAAQRERAASMAREFTREFT